MRTTSEKVGYFCTALKKTLSGTGFACPSCGHAASDVVDRKWLVTTLRRCTRCGLLFRAPTTDAAENRKIYQTQYQEGFTTELPDEAGLGALLAQNFHGTEKDYTRYLEALAALGGRPGAALFDYGCSWGYGSYQFRTAGYRVDSYEISAPRARYAAERLTVNIVPPERATPGAYDVFFSAHVIEHVPSVRTMIDFGLSLLRPGGLFVAFTPNANAVVRQHRPADWHQLWGLVHPQIIDRDYLEKLSAELPVVTDSFPYAATRADVDACRGFRALREDGDELMFVIQKRA